jgi:hypothetical protein
MKTAVRHRPTSVRSTDGDARVLLVCGEIELASWPLPGFDLAVVDELARMQLAARHVGCSIALSGAPDVLLELLDLIGLRAVVPVADELAVEVGREAEEAEQVGVEEVVMPDDPVA